MTALCKEIAIFTHGRESLIVGTLKWISTYEFPTGTQQRIRKNLNECCNAGVYDCAFHLNMYE